MPKGRVFAPKTDNDGIWYQHRGHPDQGTPVRTKDTTTGFTLEEPFTKADYPPSPPKPYHLKNADNFSLSNKFSDHDNRNSFQDHGVYFGNGKETRSLGRRAITSLERQHFTSMDYLHHDSIVPMKYDKDSIYSSDYKSRPNSEPPVRRRFPKNYTPPQEGPTELDTSTTKWDTKFPNKRLPIRVLAVSQQPYLPKNNWSYSYHGMPRCYPTLTK